MGVRGVWKSGVLHLLLLLGRSCPSAAPFPGAEPEGRRESQYRCCSVRVLILVFFSFHPLSLPSVSLSTHFSYASRKRFPVGSPRLALLASEPVCAGRVRPSRPPFR